MLGGSENFLTALKSSTLENFARDLGVCLPPAPVTHEKLYVIATKSISDPFRVDMLMVKIFELEPYDAFQRLLHGESDDEGQRPLMPKDEKKTCKKRKRDEDFDERNPKKGKGKHVCPPLE